eukprot:9467751-Karenia_brevis.AAC.1
MGKDPSDTSSDANMEQADSKPIQQYADVIPPLPNTEKPPEGGKEKEKEVLLAETKKEEIVEVHETPMTR